MYYVWYIIIIIIIMIAIVERCLNVWHEQKEEKRKEIAKKEEAKSFPNRSISG